MCAMGDTIYDVRREGGGGQEMQQIYGQTVQILQTKRAVGRGGQKIPKLCARHIWSAAGSS